MSTLKNGIMVTGMTLALSCTLMSSVSRAADASVGVDFASSYVFRGGTLNDSFVA